MKLGLSSFSFGWRVGPAGRRAGQALGLPELIAYTHTCGLHLLQAGDNLPLEELPPAELDRAREQLARWDIRLELCMRGLNRQRLERQLELARFFHADFIRAVIDAPGYAPGEEAVLAILKDAVPLLERDGVRLGVENHDRFPSAVLARILRRVGGGQVGICLDTANSFGAGEGFRETAEALLPYTVGLHLKDFIIRRLAPHGMGFLIEGAPAGQGMLDIPALLEAVARRDSDMHCILETWTPPGGTDRETCEAETRFVRQSLQYLIPLFGGACADGEIVL